MIVPGQARVAIPWLAAMTARRDTGIVIGDRRAWTATDTEGAERWTSRPARMR
jgi:hypothetical protein